MPGKNKQSTAFQQAMALAHPIHRNCVDPLGGSSFSLNFHFEKILEKVWHLTFIGSKINKVVTFIKDISAFFQNSSFKQESLIH